MKNNILFLGFLLVVVLFSSCDRWGNYQYQVKNKSSNSIDVIFQNFEDKTLKTKTIKPGDSLVIIETRTENLGKHEKPKGVWKKNDTISDIESIEIRVDKKYIDKDFRIAKYWIYNAESLKIGKYNLEIKDIKE